MAKLHFFGAAQEVTGSCYLLETCGKKILLDCGLHQGGDTNGKKHHRAQTDIHDQRSFHFDPTALDGVVLSHAHLDHSGLLPKLVHEGYRGPIYCTGGTRKLLKVLLEDAAHLYLKDLEYENLRLAREGRKIRRQALYTLEDVHLVLDLCKTHNYEHPEEINENITLTFFDAGHILGSSIVEIRIEHEQRTKRLVFSGDLGNPETSLMNDFHTLQQADVVLLESTYGDRNHRPLQETLDEFCDILREAEQTNGNILIPSFAVGRAQELLFHLGLLYHQGLLKNWHVFLDSPMASAVTEIYSHCLKQLDRKDVAKIRQVVPYDKGQSLTDFLPNLTITENVQDSMRINQVRQGAIIIAGSGMCTGGRIRHHFKHRLWYKNTHLVIIGYQAQGTLGRILVDGAKRIKLFGQTIAVKASIHTLGGFSAHAGQRDLLAWAGSFTSRPQFYLVHGEARSMEPLAAALWDKYRISAQIPAPNSIIQF
jgi:metallo-beta-lactamase family protein